MWDILHIQRYLLEVWHKEKWAASADHTKGGVYPSCVFSCCLLKNSFCSPGLRLFTLLIYSNGCENIKIMDMLCTEIIFLPFALRSTGAKQECPIEISPNRMVVGYQGPSQTAKCTKTTGNDAEMFWQVTSDIRNDSEIWTANTHEDWDAKPFCNATIVGIGNCKKPLDFTLYSMYLGLFVLSLLST